MDIDSYHHDIARGKTKDWNVDFDGYLWVNEEHTGCATIERFDEFVNSYNLLMGE